jgi:hypothetical protein
MWSDKSFRLLINSLVLAIFSLVVPTNEATAQRGGSQNKPYRLVPLSLNRGTAFAMNEAVVSGSTTRVQAVGEVDSQPFHWSVAATSSSQSVLATPLIEPEGFAGATLARDINNAGIIVGYGYTLDGTCLGVVWQDRLAEPVVLPLPDGFSGYGIRATNINNPTNGSGIILGTIDGTIVTASGTLSAVGAIVWRYSFDANAELVLSPPTWFSFSSQDESNMGLNDAGWIALTEGAQALRYRLDWEWQPTGDGTEMAEVFYLAEGGGSLLSSNVQWARTGGINQAGDVAVYYRPLNASGDTLLAKRLGGNDLAFPKFTTKRDQVDVINHVQAINNATTQHAVQVLGNAGWLNTRYGSYLNPRPAIWESGGTVRLLEEITTYPADTTYFFRPIVTSMHDLNDASWICGNTVRGVSGQQTDIPTVLIRNP